TVYAGPLATMPAQELGRIDPGEPRRFEFVATLPEAGPAVDQNALQGAAMNVAYIWTASEATDDPERRPPGGGGDAGGTPAADELDLAVTKVRHRIRRGRLVVWLSCDHPCAVAVRGRLRARDEDDRRRAKLRSRADHTFEAGAQKLTVRLPRGMRRWLRADPSHERVRARATFVAWDQAGDRDTVKRALRLRSAR
ncbi:MAG TPA: hypothetical protein VFB52_13070, partial [Solirubrobacterales bacterium]|nr:hypothetical protein [Solirubrobacterales bacterium]